jgi:hypothetical protein
LKRMTSTVSRLACLCARKWLRAPPPLAPVIVRISSGSRLLSTAAAAVPEVVQRPLEQIELGRDTPKLLMFQALIDIDMDPANIPWPGYSLLTLKRSLEGLCNRLSVCLFVTPLLQHVCGKPNHMSKGN